jgi:tetratricopeptide (TPR) repeat protein
MAALPHADRRLTLLRALADRIDSSDPGACNNLGVLYYAKGLYAEAVVAFLRALALAPRMRVAARNLVVAAAREGACDEPIRALEARIAADAGDREAGTALARLLRLLGRGEEAGALLDALLRDDPDDGPALRERGLLEQAGGDLCKAQRWLERALASTPDDGLARLHLAEVLYRRGASAQALGELDALLSCDAANAEAHLLRGVVLGDLGQQDAAAEASRRARALDPALAALEADLALDPALAADVALDPALAALAALEADVAPERRRTSASGAPTGGAPAGGVPTGGVPTGGVPAIPICHGLVETPASTEAINDASLARYRLGLALRQRGDFGEARREFERAATQGEDARLVRHALAELDLVQGRHADAVARFEALLAERGDDARCWNEHGVALHQGGDVPAAVASYRRALQVDPRYALAHNNLGVALADLGEVAPAREALERAMQVEPTLACAPLNLARWYLGQCDPHSALAVLRDLVAFHPALADAWHEMGRALTALDRLEEARQAITTAIEHHPDHAEARDTLVELLTLLDDPDGAVRETQYAHRLSPVRRAPRLTVGIALHDECPDAVGPLNLLALVATKPLAGTSVHPEALDTLLHARTLLLAADAFAATGVHGEAHERYAQARALLDTHAAERSMATDDTAPSEVAPWSVRSLVRRALLGEIRTACLLDRGVEAFPRLSRFGAWEAQRDPEVLALTAAVHAARAAPPTPSAPESALIAASAMDALLQHPIGSAALLHFAGDAALQLSDDARALALYRRALALDPTRPSPRLAIARVLAQRGEWLAAYLELVAARAAAPAWREVHLAIAALHLATDRVGEAVRALADWLVRAPRDAGALARLGDALHRAGRDAEAREARVRWQRLLETAPEHAAATRARAALTEVAHALADPMASASAPSRDATRRGTPAGGRTSRPTPVRVTPVRPTPVRVTPVRVTPVRLTPVHITPVGMTPVHITPVGLTAVHGRIAPDPTGATR